MSEYFPLDFTIIGLSGVVDITGVCLLWSWNKDIELAMRTLELYSAGLLSRSLLTDVVGLLIGDADLFLLWGFLGLLIFLVVLKSWVISSLFLYKI